MTNNLLSSFCSFSFLAFLFYSISRINSDSEVKFIKLPYSLCENISMLLDVRFISSTTWFCESMSPLQMKVSILILNLNVDPFRYCDSNSIMPPNWSSIIFDIDKPKPIPPLFILFDSWESLPNNLNNWAYSSSLIPMPVSSIVVIR